MPRPLPDRSLSPRRALCAALGRTALAALLALAAPPVLAQAADPVRLGAGDVLQLKVFGQPELSDQYELGPGGLLVIPGLGTVEQVSDLATARAAVSALIDTNFGLTGTAFALTVARYRPVVVGGAVASPGEVAFRPALRVVAAVALAGGPGAGGDISRRIQINQEAERLAQAETRLARALVRQQRLLAQQDGLPFDQVPAEAVALIGPSAAQDLFVKEQEIATNLAETRALALRRIEASLEIGDEDITAQSSIFTSLSRQLELVRGNLEDLEPLFEQGTISGARILELRRDFVDIEGRVGEAGAALARARTTQAVLSEDRAAFDLQTRLDLLADLIATQFDLLDAETTRQTAGASLEAAGEGGLARDPGPGDCRVTLLRDGPDGLPLMLPAEALTPLQPGDYLQVGRMTRDCPDFLAMIGTNQ